jgi:NhaA family Na+:H+ antiporter
MAEFLHGEAVGGAVLLVAAAVALLWANLAPGGYHALWYHHLPDHVLGLSWPHDPKSWVADGLMAIYFFVAGLEVKREVTTGELADRRVAAFPVAGAIGGMLIPALCYASLNASGPAANGWGIPMATDIAFALAVLAVVGRGLPSQVRVFLLSLAVVDDLGAILVIAIFYGTKPRPIWLLVAGLFAVVIYGGFHVRGTQLWIAFVGAVGLWIALFQAGIHPTLAGVIAGAMAPSGRVIDRLLHAVHPISNFLAAPLFALASAGLVLSAGEFRDAIGDRVFLGVMVGLVVGKPVGILLGCSVASRLGLADRPAALTWSRIAGIGAVSGIGFTVSLLVSDLAFPEGHDRTVAQLAVLLAAVIAALVATVVLRFVATGPDGEVEASPAG